MSSTSDPHFLLVRHGITMLNDPSSEAIRGHSDIPLSEDGILLTRQVAEFISKQHYSITKILSSHLQRAVMTANIISEATGGKVLPTKLLSPWDLGSLTGKRITEVAPKM